MKTKKQKQSPRKIVFHSPSVSTSDHEYVRQNKVYASTATRFGCNISHPKKVVRFSTKENPLNR